MSETEQTEKSPAPAQDEKREEKAGGKGVNGSSPRGVELADKDDEKPEIAEKAGSSEAPPAPAEAADAAAAEETAKPEAPPLLAKGNPLRRYRGGVTAGAGSLVAFLLMAHN